MKKIIKIVYRTLLGSCLLCLGMFIGMYLSQREIQKEAKRLTINTIAVVNMDEGITIEGHYTNYAAELINYPDVNFITVGLEEARQGVEAGNYAAYILIPSEFSKNVVSLNETPDSASIEYAVNPNLRNDIYSEVIADIVMFTANLNDNIEYMYLNSILTEFHEAQDVAIQIMENDTADMELLLAIENEEITHHINLTPISMPEYNLSFMDLSPYHSSVQELMGEIAQLYESYASAGKEAFSGIAGSGNTLSEQLTEVSDLIKNVDFAKDANGNDIIANGVISVEQYVEGVIAQNAETVSRITTGINNYQTLIDTEVTQMLQDEVAQTLSDNVNQYNQNMLAQIESEANTLVSITQELSEPDLLEEADYERLEEELEEVLTRIQELKGNTFALDESKINAMADQLSASTTANMQAIVDDMKSYQYLNAEEVGTIVTNSILIPLQNNQTRIAGDIQNAVLSATSAMTAYQNSVQQFDIYGYVNEGEVRGVILEVKQELSAMQSAIQVQDSEYRELVYEIYQRENETLQSWQNDILEADALSAQKLEEGLAAAKESRSTSNRQNVELLYALTQKLPYTRIGSMEFTDAYEFIVAPVETTDVGKQQRAMVFGEGIEYRKYIIILLVFMSCILLVRLGYRAFYKQRKAHSEEEQSIIA